MNELADIWDGWVNAHTLSWQEEREILLTLLSDHVEPEAFRRELEVEALSRDPVTFAREFMSASSACADAAGYPSF